MENKPKLFRHPIHALLIVIPQGLFVTAIIFDTVFLFVGDPALSAISFFSISFGILGAALAAAFGFIDWLEIPAKTHAKNLGIWHGVGSIVVVLLFAISCWLRTTTIEFIPSALALAFSYGAILLTALTAWLGDELVYCLDISMERNANWYGAKPVSSGRANTSGKTVVARRGFQANRN